MKKLITLAFGSLVAIAANAQSFSDGFDNVTFTTNGATSTNSTTAGNFAGDTVNSVITWLAVNNSVGGPGLSGWFNTSAQAAAVFAPQAGAGQINANFNNSTGSNAIDNYLMSAVRTFNNGDTISFYARTSTTPTFPDRLILKLSTAGTSSAVSSFSTTLLTINPNLTVTGFPNTYTQFTTTISGLSGPTSGRFAFNYNVTNAGPAGLNSDFIGIDTVQYTASSVPEPASMSLLALGAVAMLRKRRNSA